MFVDQVEISVQAGDGGDGCASFRREKYVSHGGPDGGDGGRGGDVIFEANPSLTTLTDLRYQQLYKAESGHSGRGKQMTGRSGKTLVIKIPVGTLVKDLDTDEMLADLKAPGVRFVSACGGDGGHGNTRFKTSTNRAPRKFEPGHPGEKRKLFLELKLLADVGIIGLPNAGKSTLISRISNARPKIADYPFTTLVPNLGVVKVGDYQSFVAADIPGLIAGAHAGKGLGIRFLKHTERTRLLVHLLDFSAEHTGDPIADYQVLQEELRHFSQQLSLKPQILVPSKMDSPTAQEKFAGYETRLKKLNPMVFPISSVSGKGINELLWKIKDCLAMDRVEKLDAGDSVIGLENP